MTIDGITEEQMDRAVRALWSAGFDTVDIAALMHLPQARAAALLAKMRQADRAEAPS